MSAVLLLLVATLLCGLLFTLAFGYARRIDNYSLVDVVWSYAFGAVAVAYAVLSDGWWPRTLLITAMAVIWSARLGTHLFVRVKSHHPVEDGRYQEMRQRWAANFHPQMFRFFLWQALSVVVLALPFLIPNLNAVASWHPLEWAGAAIWFVGLAGESLADRQLAKFKHDPANRGRVCDVGLWRYSRHPNYFFEWLIWVGFFVFACGSRWGWITLLCPASILYLLLRVTGIPMAEEQSLRSRGDAYRDYQQRTSAFFPWFPKRSS